LQQDKQEKDFALTITEKNVCGLARKKISFRQFEQKKIKIKKK
jgi:hypothetical protein